MAQAVRFLTARPEFDFRPVDVGFVVTNMAVRMVPSQYVHRPLPVLFHEYYIIMFNSSIIDDVCYQLKTLLNKTNTLAKLNNISKNSDITDK